MKSVNQILTEIRKQISLYDQVKNSNDINILLNIQDNIAIRSFTLANYVGDYKTSYNAHYFIRKISIAKSSMVYQKKDWKQGTADTQALIDHENEYLTEQEHEATAVTMELLLRQTNIILQSMQQRISYLKQEKFKTENQNSN